MSTNISTENNWLVTETTKNFREKDKIKKIYYISNLDKKKNWNDSEKEYLKFFNYLNEKKKIKLKSTIDNLESREKLKESSENLVSKIHEFNKINSELNNIKKENKELFEIKFKNNFNFNIEKYKSNFDKKKIEMKKLEINLNDFENLNKLVKKETKKLKENYLNKNLFYSNKEYITTEFINREDYRNRDKIEKCKNFIKGIEVLKTIENNENIEEIEEVKKKKDNKFLKNYKKV